MSTRYVGENDSLDALWELREVDAWPESGGGWTWNGSSVLRRFRSDSVDLKGLFLRVLADCRGRMLPKGVFRVDDGDWNVLEVKRRKDGCPVYAIVRLTPQ